MMVHEVMQGQEVDVIEAANSRVSLLHWERIAPLPR
jgi:hypothetical protein